MPPRQLVPQLRNLAMQSVANTIIDSAITHKLYLNKSVQIPIENNLPLMPANLREDILRNILQCEKLGSLDRFYCLQLLLYPSIECLRIGIFPDSYNSRILDVIIDQGGGLISLDLRGVWVKGSECYKLCDLLMKLPQLTCLRIPHMATDGIIRTISICNKALRILDMCGECSVTRRGIDALCSGSNNQLELVNIGRPGDATNITPETIALLIQHLPNLTSLGCYAHTGRALVCFSKDSISRPTKLRYLHDTGTDLDVLNTIHQLCPNLSSIYLDRPNEDIVPRLYLLKCLRDIKLSRFECSELNQLLMKCGVKIVSLNLVIGHGILDASAIAERCTQIRSLQLYKVEHIVYFKQIAFTCLRKLDLFYSTLSTTCLRYFISSSPQLENMCLYSNFLNLSDRVINEIFTDNVYKCMKRIRISNASLLGNDGLRILLMKCPNLNRLGYLGTWGLTPEEIEELQVYIRTTNLDLSLEY